MHSDKFKLLRNLRLMPGDERGSVTLLAGTMVFLVAIFGIITIDTSMAIHNRVVTQNAVDSAADSAALWQARGCNMLQLLNNLHYDVDTALAIGEGAAAVACVASAALLAAQIAADVFFGAGEAVIRPIRMVACVACDTLPAIDLVQQKFYPAVTNIQQGIVLAMPQVAFLYANACAKGAGADRLGEALPAAANSLLRQFGLDLEGPLNGVSSVLGAIDVYAAPLDPDSFLDSRNKGLFVKARNNDGTPPLKWPSFVGELGDKFGLIGCQDSIPTYPTAKNLATQAGWDGEWGWNDQYFFGHPGFSTWIAGKTNRNELLGFGNLRWLNGGENAPEMDYEFGQRNLGWYNGEVRTQTGTPLEIPGYVAIASSQVEGTPVIAHTDGDGVNARGKLIKVFLPSTSGGSPTAVDKEPFFIYH
jgi:hypothetical protein